jgi:hypothetical protein
LTRIFTVTVGTGRTERTAVHADANELLTECLGGAAKGHFKKRGASWYFWIELDVGPDGARKQKSVGGFKTRKEAEHAYSLALRNVARRRGQEVGQ